MRVKKLRSYCWQHIIKLGFKQFHLYRPVPQTLLPHSSTAQEGIQEWILQRPRLPEAFKCIQLKFDFVLTAIQAVAPQNWNVKTCNGLRVQEEVIGGSHRNGFTPSWQTPDFPHIPTADTSAAYRSIPD
ncbi:hypothetical protein ACET3X_009524 [Alternaria dauci]|uniref:Uncharacterized protein n=1 Tax=Alternaria dauci TaxID=48095 RepID=A0ABR3U722_9PLEO